MTQIAARGFVGGAVESERPGWMLKLLREGENRKEIMIRVSGLA